MPQEQQKYLVFTIMKSSAHRAKQVIYYIKILVSKDVKRNAKIAKSLMEKVNAFNVPIQYKAKY